MRLFPVQSSCELPGKLCGRLRWQRHPAFQWFKAASCPLGPFESEGQGSDFVLEPTGNQGLCPASRHKGSFSHDGSQSFGHSPRHLAGEKDFYDRGSPLHRVIASRIPYHFLETGAGSALRRKCLYGRCGVFAAQCLEPGPLSSPSSQGGVPPLPAPCGSCPAYDPHFSRTSASLLPLSIRSVWPGNSATPTPFLRAYQLSDRTLRFLAPATALLQPGPPSLMLMDEPEPGQHPQALALLAELLKSAASRSHCPCPPVCCPARLLHSGGCGDRDPS